MSHFLSACLSLSVSVSASFLIVLIMHTVEVSGGKPGTVYTDEIWEGGRERERDGGLGGGGAVVLIWPSETCVEGG